MADTPTIRKIDEGSADIYFEGKKIGTVTSAVQFDDFRAQVCRAEVEGYSVRWKNQEMYIDKDGRLDHWPVGFFDKHTDILGILICGRDWVHPKDRKQINV